MERGRERERKLASGSETKRLGLDARGGLYTCVHALPATRGTNRERPTMRYRRADGWMEEGGWRMSG